MGGFTTSIVIDRPVEEVAAFLSDLLNDPRWRREWVGARPASDQGSGVGTRTLLIGQFLGRRTEVVYEVSRSEAARLTEWETVSGPLPLTFRREFEPAERGGATLVTFTYEAHPNAVLRLLEPFVVSLGRRQLDGDVPSLRAILEA
ncbi:hypothetical protein GCM10023168_17990 [Fodinibacter luteus]|uniref:Polyketide cyclase n=1 Tax=Fodinibacter luteus TaxID=552064 RepID=A0ABP8KEW5_9MICO